MAKLKVDSLISVEIEKLQTKVNQFQDYLEQTPIVGGVDKHGRITLSEDDQDKLHKEIVIQIKMQDALFNWLPLLEKLKQADEEKEIMRGGTEANLLFKNKQ